jgi:hypothetical protein
MKIYCYILRYVANYFSLTHVRLDLNILVFYLGCIGLCLIDISHVREFLDVCAMFLAV